MLLRRPAADADIVAAVLRGETERFSELVGRYQNLIFGSIVARVGRQDAEDLTQETFLKGFSRLPQLEDPHRFGLWLRRIALNAAKSYLRSQEVRGRGDVPPDAANGQAAPPPDTIIETQEERNRVWAALSELPAPEREAVVLYYLEAQSQAVIAGYLGISVGAVKGRLTRARQRLRDMLTDREIKRAIRKERRGRRFRRGVMSSLPLVAWPVEEVRATSAVAPGAGGSASLPWWRPAAVALVLGGVLLGGGMLGGVLLERGQWSRAEGAREQHAPAYVRLATRPEYLQFADASRFGGMGPSLFLGPERDANAERLEQLCLSTGRGGQLVWEFDQGAEGWVAWVSPMGVRRPLQEPVQAVGGQLVIPAIPGDPHRFRVRLVSPEIDYDTRLFTSVRVRLRRQGVYADGASPRVSWTTSVNRLTPGAMPATMLRNRSKEDWNQARCSQQMVRLAGNSDGWVEYGADLKGGAASGWEGRVADLRVSLWPPSTNRAVSGLGDVGGGGDALLIDRISLTRGDGDVMELPVPTPGWSGAGGEWPDQGSLTCVEQKGVEWPLVADVDGDGDLDVLVLYRFRPESEVVEWGTILAVNPGDGGFRPGQRQVISRTEDGSGVRVNSDIRVDVGQFDGDGRADLAVRMGGGVWLLRGQGDGRFTRERLCSECSLVGMDPMEADGPDAIVVRTRPRGDEDAARRVLELVVMREDTAGSLEALSAPLETDASWGWVEFGDMDGDGVGDLVWWSAPLESSSSVVVVYEINRDGQWEPVSRLTYEDYPESREYYFRSPPLLVSDLSGDGAWEMGVAAGAMSEGPETTRLGLIPVVRGAVAPRVAWMPLSLHCLLMWCVATWVQPQVWDLNGDGVYDPVLVNANYKRGPSLVVLDGAAFGREATVAEYALPGQPRGWGVGDFNGDALADVVVVTEDREMSGLYLLTSRNGHLAESAGLGRERNWAGALRADPLAGR